MKSLYWIIAGILALVLAGVFLIGNNTKSPAQETGGTIPEVTEPPTTFAEVGTLTFGNPGSPANAPLLVYEEPGRPAVTATLILDALSFCATNTGAVPCMAMSATLDQSFGGKRVIVEGIMQDDESVLVRKLTALREGEEPRLREPGSIFISWPNALQLIRTCQADMVMQTHALDVNLTLLDGREVRSVEPTIDEVFKITNEAQESCGAIIIATE